MKKTKKNDRITQIIAGILVALLGVFVWILSAVPEDKTGGVILLLLGILLVVVGVISFIVGVVSLVGIIGKEKKAKERIVDPTSLAYLTYGGNGGNGGYKHYFVIPDKKKQSSKNAAVNAAGVAGFLVGGVGTVTWGFQSIDCFISGDEMIFNSREKNPGLEDGLFKRYNADKIDDIAVAGEDEYTKLSISLVSGKILTVHIPDRDTEKVRKDFLGLKKPVQN